MQVNFEAMPEIPEEIVVQLLSRLPVVSLLRFRCVSKSWKSLIDSPDFIKMHLNNALKSRSNVELILSGQEPIDEKLFCADFDSVDNTNSAIFKELNHPLTCPPRDFSDFLGSCNGLLCLSIFLDEIILWNPATRKYQRLPRIALDFPWFSCIYIHYGFGYDSFNDDYTVVRILQLYEDLSDDVTYSEVKVYSLKFNTWRGAQDCPYRLLYDIPHGVLANGAFHWVGGRKLESDADMIVAFELRTQEFRLVPQHESWGKGFSMKLAVLGECLCVCRNYSKDCTGIWVMKEYGIQESWTNIMSIKASDLCSNYLSDMKAVAYSKCGRRVLFEYDHRCLFWYDLDKKSADYLEMEIPLKMEDCSWHVFFELNTCSQSLVKLSGGTQDFGKVEESASLNHTEQQSKIQ